MVDFVEFFDEADADRNLRGPEVGILPRDVRRREKSYGNVGAFLLIHSIRNSSEKSFTRNL
jgi:hypothetical protein